jgi:aminopeptidase N
MVKWLLLLLAIPVHMHAQIFMDKGIIDRIAGSESIGNHCMAKGGGDAGPARGYDLTFHRLQLQIDPAINAIQGTVTHHFIATEDLSELKLDLSSALTITAVTDGSDPIAFTHADDTLSIQFASPIEAGVLDSVSITYAGTPPDTGFGSFVQSDHEGTPIIWTLSEPYGAKDWWPSKQDLHDKADSVHISILVPQQYKAVSNGVLVNETLMGAQTLYEWRHGYPIAFYLVAFAVTNYEVTHSTIVLTDVTVPMETWSYPENTFEMLMMVADIQEQMPLFSDLFGTYPFADEKYGHAQFGWGGGMEHQTISFMGGVSYELAAHELAHQWFGDKVTCGSWQDLWLNEGFASYLQGLCYDFLAPEYWHGWKAAQIADIVSQPDGSVFVPDTNDISRLFSARLTYRKGAFVLHMLRWILGDDDFFQACRNYLDDPELAFGSAGTDDLKAHLEAVSGLDLTGFFNDWYHGEGHPMYHVEWSQDAGGLVNFMIEQTPSHPSVDFFELPVPIRFSNAANDTIVVVDHTFSGQVFTAQLPFTATLAEFDPELWLISGQNVVVGVPSNDDDGSIQLHPNPAEDQLIIQLNEADEKIELRVVDASGRSCIERTIGAGTMQVQMDVSGLSAGSYILESRSDQRVRRNTFIKR